MASLPPNSSIRSCCYSLVTRNLQLVSSQPRFLGNSIHRSCSIFPTFPLVINGQPAIVLFNIYNMIKCGIKQSLRLQPCKHNDRHTWTSMSLEFFNWVVFGVAWISLSVELSSQPTYCTTPNGSRLWTEPCNTLYAAYALSIFGWVLFCTSYAYVAYAMLAQAVDQLREKQANERSKA